MPKSSSQPLVNLIGWYGVVAIVVAYSLVNFQIIELVSYPYLFLNISGSLAILAEAWSKKDYQPVVLNLIWFVVACVALVHAARL